MKKNGKCNLGKQSEVHMRYIAEVKKRFNRCTPYRLGVAVGEALASVKCPYASGSRAEKNYFEGVFHGKRFSKSDENESETTE